MKRFAIATALLAMMGLGLNVGCAPKAAEEAAPAVAAPVEDGGAAVVEEVDVVEEEAPVE